MKGIFKLFIDLILYLEEYFKISYYNNLFKNYKIKRRLKGYGTGVDLQLPIVIKNPYMVEFGNNVSIASFVHIWGGGGVKIGNNVLIGSHCCIISETHDYLAENVYHSHIRKSIIIEDNVWIGAHVMVLPGITVRSGSIIGAGSVVTKDTEENFIYVGSPAKKLKCRIEKI